MACVAVTSLVRTLEIEFLQPQPRPVVVVNELISGNEDLIKSLHGKLEPLMEQFDEYRMDGVEAIELLESNLRDVASRVEDEVEFQIADLHGVNILLLCKNILFGKGKSHPSVKLHHILQQAIQEINHIEDELVKVKNTIDQQGINMATLDVLPKSDEMGDFSQHASHMEDLMVGKHDEFETIQTLLIQRASDQHKVISIKGMGGIGKTTLAKRLYEDPSIVSHFDKRAWVVVSQHHNKRQMLLDLLKSMGSNSEERDSDGDLALRLKRGLLGERYLIVMDDVWTTEAWDAVKACFPDYKNGSRVLLTTRLEEVANYTSSKYDFSHQMHFLNQTESWNLFHEKALLKGMCHGAEFETIARPIVEKCRGLPLAILVAAGLFSKLNTLDEWKNIAEALNSSATTIGEACSAILSLSYNNLPYNLKACLLYLGVFPEDEEIYASNLARLWAAEGLVKALENESVEVVGEKHIQELCNRNLILVSKQSSDGRKIKAFRLHDVLHVFCVREAQRCNLLNIVSINGLSPPSQKDFRWLSIQSLSFDTQTLGSSSKNCRSIFYFPKTRLRVVHGPHLILQDFNILRVLYGYHKLHIGQSRTVSEVEPPVHLRYLSSSFDRISTLRMYLPYRLWNIQTVVAGDGFLSNSSLGFPHLCYYYCGWISSPYPPMFIHQNLHTISGMYLSSCTRELSTKVPYLKKLRICSYGQSLDALQCIGLIENLAYFQQLESLNIEAHPGFFKYPINNQIALLKNLKKLSFYNTHFFWEEINVLSSLPRLEVLKLRADACMGRRWKLREEEKFCQLISLRLDGSGREHWGLRGNNFARLEHWEVSGDNFPKLEHLKLHRCWNLQKIPSSFADILTLKSIQLLGCLPSAVTSAKQVQEEQYGLGKYNMVVIEKYTMRLYSATKAKEEEEEFENED